LGQKRGCDPSLLRPLSKLKDAAFAAVCWQWPPLLLLLLLSFQFPLPTRLLLLRLQVSVIYEPTVLATIIVPQQYCGAVMKLAVARRGTQLDYSFMGGSSSSSSSSSASSDSSSAAERVSSSSSSSSNHTSSTDVLEAAADAADTSSSSSSFLASDRVLLRYQLPLAELAGDFYSKLKSATQG
jgi:translation elongation factor EF-G